MAEFKPRASYEQSWGMNMNRLKQRVAVALTAGLLLGASDDRAWAADVQKNIAPRSAKDLAAVDLAAPFAGFYVGGNIGYALGAVSATDKDFYNSGGSWSYDTEAATVGIQFGYNWQRGALLIGVEGELGYMDFLGLDDKGTDPSSPAGDTQSYLDSGFHAALTGRIGVVSGATLFYAKGGLAFLNAAVNVDDICNQGPCGGETLKVFKEDTLTGWTLGGGVEHAISSKWSIKAEYLYHDFGTIDAEGITSGLETTSWEHDVTAHTVKLGVNRRIGGGRSQLP
jgi:outer membrane immunogenic protein